MLTDNPEKHMSNSRLFLLGPTRLEKDGLPIKFARQKMFALLAYLAVTGESYNREALIGMLWPNFNEAQAHAYLRNNLWSLREVLGEECGCFEQDHISLDQIPELWTDVLEFRRLISIYSSHSHPDNEICQACMTPLSEAVHLYRGDFMAGFNLRDSEQFNEWQFYEAESLRRDLAEILNRLALGKSAQRQFEQAIHYAKRYLALDKYNEQAVMLLIEILAWAGQPAAALRQYHEFVNILKKEFDALPAEDTTALVQSIKAGKIPPLPSIR